MQVLLSKFLPAIGSFLSSVVVYVLAVLGGLFLAYGVWLIYNPAGYMALGVLLILAALDSRQLWA